MPGGESRLRLRGKRSRAERTGGQGTVEGCRGTWARRLRLVAVEHGRGATARLGGIDNAAAVVTLARLCEEDVQAVRASSRCPPAATGLVADGEVSSMSPTANRPGAPFGGSARATDQTAGDARSETGRWLSIQAACELMGVDQSTLRRWSDAGKVPVFRTPGGHRRYAESDLRAMLGDGPAREAPRQVSPQSLTDRSLSAYAEEYLRGARDRRWYRAYGTATQEEHRRLGRRLVDLAVRYASVAPMAGDRASLLEEGRQIGAHYGRSGASLGLTASEAVEAFLYFRHPVVDAVSTMIEEEELAARRAVRLFAAINVFMDQVLIATMEAHERRMASVRAGPREVADEPESMGRKNLLVGAG